MKLPVLLRAAQVDNYTPNRDAAQLRIYTAPVPASSDAPLGAPTLLSVFTYATPSFAAANPATAIATAFPLGPEVDAPATGVAAFARAYQGAACVGQHTVSVLGGGGEVQLPALGINQHDFLMVLTHTLTQPDGP
jgi:hypothetical protein